MSGQTPAAWRVLPADPTLVRRLADAFAFHPLAMQVLVARGLTTEEHVSDFLDPDWRLLHNPSLMHDLDKAVHLLVEALQARRKILVYGDYDVDGVCAVSLVIHTLRAFGADCDYYIPNRIREGYGLHAPVLAGAAERGTSLLLTVDTGVAQADEVAYARRLGMTVIVSDHHQLPATLPEADALVHPAHPEGRYPFKDLCGAAVAFKLMTALAQQAGKPAWARDLIDWVALATVADVMPLVDENRAFVRLGLERIRQAPRRGIAALCELARLDPQAVTARELSFALAPRINAVGRMAQADIAVELMLAETAAAASEYALLLEAANRERQQVQTAVLAEARERAAGCDDPVLVLCDPAWHAGVIGITAARLAEELQRPVLLATEEDGIVQGSARSVAGFPITDALARCADLLLAYGGHDQAAGFRLAKADLPELQARLAGAFAEMAATIDGADQIVCDAELPLAQLDARLLDDLARLEPFGEGNPEPKFLVTGARVLEARAVGRERDHLKLRLAPGVDGIAFGNGHLLDRIRRSAHLALVATPQYNTWQGRNEPELLVHHLAPTMPPAAAPAAAADGGAGQALDRDGLAVVYRQLRRRLTRQPSVPLAQLLPWLARQTAFDITHLEQGLTVFAELGLIHVERDAISLAPAAGKVDLSASPTYRQLQS